MSPRKAPVHKWAIRARFRRNAFVWKSQPAIRRIKEAVSEAAAEAMLSAIDAMRGIETPCHPS